MEETLRRAPSGVGTYLGRLRWAALGLLALRAGVVGLGALVLGFAVAAVVVGPAASAPAALAAWSGIALVALGAAAWSALPAPGIGGGAVARLLGSRDPWLASAARSAFELSTRGDLDATSRELARAHEKQVHAALARIPLRDAIPWGWLRHGSVALAVAAAVAGITGMVTLDRAAAGRYALLHPDARRSDGAQFADVVARTHGELSFPAYMRRGPRSLRGADRVEAPVGTTVRLTVETRVPAREVRAIVEGRELLLEADGERSFTGRFVLRADTPLGLRVLDSDGRWLVDAKARSVRAIPDEAPRVGLGPPTWPDSLPLDHVVHVAYDVRDDVGIAEVTRVLRGADGREHRLVLDALDSDALVPRHEGITSFSLADIGARPGDRVALVVEARDGDVVSGPNVGRSEERVLMVDSESTRRARVVHGLEELLERGLHALADRLERPVSGDGAEARARLAVVEATTLGFAAALDAGARPDAEEGALATRDRAALRDVSGRLRRLQARETALHGASPAPASRRAAADAKLVEALEDAVLGLEDRIAHARLEDAAELARELEALRREMSSLLAELRRTEAPEARDALLAALSRARQRMDDLAARVGALGSDVPSEFVNSDGLEAATTSDALAAMREAVERGDLASAERHLLDLQSQIDGLAQMLGSAETAFGEARFGPRDRALAEALDALTGLEAEQRELSRRSDEVRRAAGERALERATTADGSDTDALVERARRARDRLRQIPSGILGTLDEEALGAAAQRAVDTEDALRGGDLGEARRMAREAIGEADALARDLELNALMFPGERGEMAEAARRARAVANELRALGDGIERAIPRMTDFVSPQERARMSSDASRQARLITGAEQLARRLAEGQAGAPLSEEAARALHEAGGEMRRADRALRQGDPAEAARSQEEAGRRLAEIRESLERDASSQPSSGGSGSGGARDALRDPGQRVEIPRAGAQAGPVDRRRKLLDAMGDRPPSGYEDAARRYYEELLR